MASRTILAIFLAIALTHIAEAQFSVPGTCPPPRTDIECTAEPEDECRPNDDAKCAELYPGQGLKCCFNGCFSKCLQPIAPPTPPLTV